MFYVLKALHSVAQETLSMSQYKLKKKKQKQDVRLLCKTLGRQPNRPTTVYRFFQRSVHHNVIYYQQI